MRESSESATTATPCVALTGNPNCGKTTLFNALTGLRAKVGNYAGVTVERKEGRLRGSSPDHPVIVLDLPGTYSLTPKSLDEQVSRDVLLGRVPEIPSPAAVVVIVDASNLERNLYYATQVIELGYPTVLALNMVDVAQANGLTLDAMALEAALGVTVIPMVASSGEGVDTLRQLLLDPRLIKRPRRLSFLESLSPVILAEQLKLAKVLLEQMEAFAVRPEATALLLLGDDKFLAGNKSRLNARLATETKNSIQSLDASAGDWRAELIEARYACVADIHSECSTSSGSDGLTFSDKLDAVLTHKVWGVLIFVAVMALMFQCIFVFARIPMDAIQAGVDAIGRWVSGHMPPGDLTSLLVDGGIAGVGAVIVFLPQILLLFVFIGFLEDTGYMSRAAFLMDRLMSKVGLHGKSFIPMLSSFACAIPGIMATRTIETPKDRLVTILVAPLMSCSARLPVYTLLIAACIPDRSVLGIFKLSGITLLAMYLIGIIAALVMAWIFKKTLLKGETPMLILELPPYKLPVIKVVVRNMWERSKIFLRRAGTVILGINILLWFLATYPRSAAITREFDAKKAAVSQPVPPGVRNPGAIAQARAEQIATLNHEEAGEKLRNSFAGRAGRLIEPLIAPLGFDWKIGIGIISSFAAREVFVSTMSTVYNVGEVDKTAAGTASLAKTLQDQKRPDGRRIYTALTGVTLMVFYVFALQCVSTVAIVRRETNSWRWPIFQWSYMGALAWLGAFITYHAGRWLGLQ